MSRTIAHTCSQCAHVDRVPMALGLTCPACGAAPSRPCTNLWTRDGRLMKTLHPARQELVEIGADRARDAVVRTLRSAS